MPVIGSGGSSFCKKSFLKKPVRGMNDGRLTSSETGAIPHKANPE